MKFSDIIVCDDVRREEGNKRTIVGAYIDKIFFLPTEAPIIWPAFKQIGVYFKIIKEKGDPIFDKFKGSIFHIAKGKPRDDAKKLGTIEGSFNQIKFTTMVIDFVVPLQLPGPGTLHLEFEVSNQQQQVDKIFRDLIEIEEQTQGQPAGEY